MNRSFIRSKLAMNQKWLERGILAIDARQTMDEQESRETRWDNNQGWNAADAKLGSYLARWIRQHDYRPMGQRLSGEWIGKGRELMRKYAGQLVRIAKQTV